MNAESAALGSAIIDSTCVPIVCGELIQQDFTTAANAAIFMAIVDLWKSGVAVDLVTISNELDSAGKLQEAGGYEYLAELVTDTPTSANVRYYIECLQDTRKRRIFATGIRKSLLAAEEGEDGFIEDAQATINEANSVGSVGITTISDLYPIVLNRLGDTTRGRSTGFRSLDAVTGGLQSGHLVIIAARPGVGKTALASNIAANICRANGSVLYYSIEMGAEEIAERISLSEAMVDKYAAQRGINGAQEKISVAQEKSWKWKLFVDDRGSLSVGQIISGCYRAMQAAGRLDCVFIDYLQLIRLPNKKNANTNQLLGEVSRALKIMAKELKCPVVALSQLNRSSEGRRPTIADLRDSGAIEQDADIVLMLHREAAQQDTETTLIIGKNRHGAVGDIPLVWNPQYTRFFEPALKTVSVPKGVFDD